MIIVTNGSILNIEEMIKVFSFMEKGVEEVTSATSDSDIEILFELAHRLIVGSNIQTEEIYKTVDKFIQKCKESEMFEVYNEVWNCILIWQ